MASLGQMRAAKKRPAGSPLNTAGSAVKRPAAVAGEGEAGCAHAVDCTPLASLEDSHFGDSLTAILESLRVRDVSAGQREPLNDYSILMEVPVAKKKLLVDTAMASARLDRAMGCMCGMGIGDAMGHMFEFLPCQDVPSGDTHFDFKTMTFRGEYNRFLLRKGQWTDDAAMGLCMADSLIVKRRYDGSDMRQRFWNWWEHGYNNAFRLDKERGIRNSVGLGGNISKSLADMDGLPAGQKPHPVFQSTGEDAGNGSLMRFAPVAIFFHAVPEEVLYHYAASSSFTTHPGVIAAEACALLAHIVVSALKRPPDEPLDPRAFLDAATAEYARISGLDAKCASKDWRYQHVRWLVTGKPERKEECCWAWRQPCLGLAETLAARGRWYNGYPVSAGYFGSYSLDGLAIALWAVYNTTSFDEAVAKSINTLGDADSHGSICGQIAGALYGLRTVHPQFLAWLNRWDEHEFAVRAVLLHELGSSLRSQQPSVLGSGQK